MTINRYKYTAFVIIMQQMIEKHSVVMYTKCTVDKTVCCLS